jgi:hypothetical protein
MFKIFVTKTELVDLFLSEHLFKRSRRVKKLKWGLSSLKFLMDMDEFYIQDGNRRILSFAFLISVIRQLALTNISIDKKCNFFFANSDDSIKNYNL